MAFPDTTFTTGTTITSNWLNAVNDKCLETVSVKDFGAVGDGVTDDTVAIKNALVAAAGSTLHFPKGTYRVVTGNLLIEYGTTIIFDGDDAKIKFESITANACFLIQNSKHINIYNLNIDMTNAANSCTALYVQGCWFLNIYGTNIVGSGVANNQFGITGISSNPSSLNWGNYCWNIYNPYIAATKYGIKSELSPGDTVRNTHWVILNGWGNGVDYPLMFDYLDTFRVETFTPEGCIDGIYITNSTDGFISLGELQCSGYGINFPDTSCAQMVLLQVGEGPTGLGVINTAHYTPVLFNPNVIRLNGNRLAIENQYFYQISAAFNSGEAVAETVNGGATAKKIRTYSDANGHRLNVVSGISHTTTQANNFVGQAQFSASSSVAVTFSTPEADNLYLVLLGGNAAGYCWVTDKTANGFTLHCSASNNNLTDWILVR